MNQVSIPAGDGKIITCKSAFACKKRWNDLRIIENEKQVRYCTDCMKPVFLCRNHEELTKHANESHCVNISVNLDSEFTGFVIVYPFVAADRLRRWLIFRVGPRKDK